MSCRAALRFKSSAPRLALGVAMTDVCHVTTPKVSMASPEITLEAIPSACDVAAEDWDACANPQIKAGDSSGSGENSPAELVHSCPDLRPYYNPFVSHAFFAAVENAGSATARTGWAPRHLLAKVGGRIVGIVPCFLKSHSQGEYVFDRGWADAYERAGGRYYPKLQCSVPFTPVTGPRLLLRHDAPQQATATLIAAMIELARRHKVSSLHVTFPTRGERERLGAAGFLQRIGQQFHWQNDGYETFENFLAALNSRKRKAIR